MALEFTIGAGIATISSVLLGFGVARLFGALLAGFMLERSLRATLAAMPLVMGIFAASLATSNSTLSMDFALITLWGLAFGAVPVAWSTWPARAANRIRFYVAPCGDDFLAKGTQSKAPMVRTAIMIQASLIA